MKNDEERISMTSNIIVERVRCMYLLVQLTSTAPKLYLVEYGNQVNKYTNRKDCLFNYWNYGNISDRLRDNLSEERLHSH